MKYLQKETAIENTQRFFSNTEGDSITLQEAFIAWGRDLTKEEENRAWFSNKLTNLKYHNLVKPVYHLRNSRRILEKVQLTLEGKKLLGRIVEAMPVTTETTGAASQATKNGTSFEEIMKIVARMREAHPEFEITFDVKLRELKS